MASSFNPLLPKDLWDRCFYCTDPAEVWQKCQGRHVPVCAWCRKAFKGYPRHTISGRFYPISKGRPRREGLERRWPLYAPQHVYSYAWTFLYDTDTHSSSIRDVDQDTLAATVRKAREAAGVKPLEVTLKPPKPSYGPSPRPKYPILPENLNDRCFYCLKPAVAEQQCGRQSSRVRPWLPVCADCFERKWAGSTLGARFVLREDLEGGIHWYALRRYVSIMKNDDGPGGASNWNLRDIEPLSSRAEELAELVRQARRAADRVLEHYGLTTISNLDM